MAKLKAWVASINFSKTFFQAAGMDLLGGPPAEKSKHSNAYADYETLWHVTYVHSPLV